MQLSNEQLRKYASLVGSDCAFFIEDKPMLGTGRGEILTEIKLNLKGKHIVLVNPEIHVSTAEAYSGVIPSRHTSSVKDIIEKLDISEWRKEVRNDFEETVFKIHPSIKSIKEKLYEHGALYACMSGSGSTVFGIFDHSVDLKNQFSRIMYWSGVL